MSCASTAAARTGCRRGLPTPTTASDPHIVATGAVEEHVPPSAGRMLRPRSPSVRMGETIDLAPAPRHGEHTDQVLEELGFDTRQVAELREAGVIR